MRRFQYMIWSILVIIIIIRVFYYYSSLAVHYSPLPHFFLSSALEELTIDTYVYYIN